MKPILEVNSISKRFLIDHERPSYLSMRDRIASTFKPKSKPEEFWALKDVSFDVMPGESIGIIGRNGAGKSTLLKILSRITPPTEGSITIRGRIASLLEVGTGFHQELTGRENIFMNGSILGMKRMEIKNKFDEIVDFSGVERFLDTPLKNYSSGMQLRLAFAVAAHLESEILIIDEVLAVGDAEFQKKCMGKMEEVTKQGRTILFVSHNIQAVSTLTSITVWLELGCVVSINKTPFVIQEYFKSTDTPHTFNSKKDIDKPHIKSVNIITSHSNHVHKHGEELKVILTLYTPLVLPNAGISFQITDDLGRNHVHCWLFSSQTPIAETIGERTLTCIVPKLKLYMGRYHVKVFFTDVSGREIYEIVDNVCPFEVSMIDHYREFPWQNNACAYLEDYVWEIKKT